jgi:hypothetical protein
VHNDRTVIVRACFFGLFLLCACSDVTTSLVDERHGGAGGATPIDSGTRTDASGATVPDGGNMSRAPAMCGDRLCHCDDGQDDDDDGLVDGLDPECTGPYDDDESSFATGSPNKHGKCRDCFWDDNAGGGDDQCSYAAACFQGPAASVGGACSCDVTDACVESCASRTPNGCDCFGCCDVRSADGKTVSVLLDETCSLDKLDDTTACPRCVQSPQCNNPCGPCELCPGRRPADLPASCHGAQPQNDHACDEGQRVCSDATSCPVDFYCQLGCCLYVVP